MRVLKSLLTISALVYVGLSLYLYLFQENFIYFPGHPSRRVETTPAALGLAFEELAIPTGDGETLAGWYVPAPNARATLLFLHGNAGNIGQRIDLIAMFQRLGLNVLIFDYRGYGTSTGKPGETGTYRDAEAAWRHLTEKRGIPASDILVFGESLGGAIAAELVRHHTPRALVLYATFTSIPDMARHYYPYLPTGLLARLRYDTRTALAAAQCPVLLLHSRDDEITPFSHGRELLDAAPQPKRLVELQGGHNDALFISNDKFPRALEEVLQATGNQ